MSKVIGLRRIAIIAGAVMLLTLVAACTREVVKEVPVEKVVTKEVVKQVEVPGKTVVVEKEVVKQVEVPGKTVVVEVVKQVEVPGKTVVVEKEVVKEVEVPGKIVVVEKIVTKEVPVEVVRREQVIVTPTPTDVKLPVTGSHLRVAVQQVGPALYHRPAATFPFYTSTIFLGIGETLMDYDGVGFSSMIADSWEFDESGVTWNLNPRIPWHSADYGHVTADDVHWTYVENNREGTLVPHAQYWGADFQDMRVLDESTLRWDWKEGPTIRWPFLPRHVGSGAPIMSSQYFDDNGEEAVNRKTIGTGPYKLVEHVSNDQIFLEGVRNHWRRNPGFELVRVIEVPEQATRIAMFNSNQTDITLVGLPLLDQVLDTPGARTVIGKVSSKSGSVVQFGGNWQTRREGNNKPAVENPWVGDPDVPGDLERAVKIRTAMSYAIDREALNEVILGGQGCVGFLYGLDTCSAHWNPDWGHTYDVEMARQLLTEGGFPDGFELTFWTAPGPGGQTKIEIDEAIVPFWEAIGLDVNIDNSAYQVRRPQFISERSMTDVWSFFYGGNVSDPDVFLDIIPDMTYGRVLSNLGYDYPEADIFADELQRTFELSEAWQGPLNDYFRFNSHLGEMFAFGTVAWIDPWVVGSGIGSVDMVIHGDGIPELESLVPAR